jgi:catechol 2,3-dioxygenase-like lactoylglutathione lyase family enzyme
MQSFLRRGFIGRLARSAAALVAARYASRSQARAQAKAGAVSGFDHVAAPMLDSKAMAAFYRALGFKVNEGARVCSVHFGDHKINFHRPELWQGGQFTLRAPAAEPPCGDFCFVWEGTADALEARLVGAGATVVEGPVKRVGGRAGGTVSGVSWYVRDPDGNLLEFIIYPPAG